MINVILSVAMACEALARTALPNTTITSAETVTGGSFTPPRAANAVPNLPAFCRVAGTIAKDPAHSYFIGCSTGGRQALMEAQRYPEDCDGIIAGAPANNLTRKEAWALDALLAMRAEPGSYLPPAVAAFLNRSVLDKCDLLDGVRDGVMESPPSCDFDARSIQCSAGASEGCLTAPQVAAVQRVYAGLKHSRTGAKLYPGLALGSETGWPGPLNPAQPFPIPISQFKWLVLRDSTWDWTTFDYSKPNVLRSRRGWSGVTRRRPSSRCIARTGNKTARGRSARIHRLRTIEDVGTRTRRRTSSVVR